MTIKCIIYKNHFKSYTWKTSGNKTISTGFHKLNFYKNNRLTCLAQQATYLLLPGSKLFQWIKTRTHSSSDNGWISLFLSLNKDNRKVSYLHAAVENGEFVFYWNPPTGVPVWTQRLWGISVALEWNEHCYKFHRRQVMIKNLIFWWVAV